MKDDRAFLGHMHDALTRIAEYTTGGREDFLADARTQDAVVRQLEILGEAAKRISAVTRALAPDVPWSRIAGMRDRLIHDYVGFDLAIVWQVVERDAPGLRDAISRLLRDAR
ncbi:MAG: DUF86 domain-containing protein [Gemmatimonadota bacterium]|nr:DUF86 domain-containing protein [Gemmatimonadota bacterium]